MTLPPDELVRRARLQDEEAVAELVRTTLPAVARLARRLGGAQLADEVVQETYLRVLRGLSRLRDPRRLQSWTLAIAANCCRELLRRQQGKPRALCLEPPAPEPEEDPHTERRGALQEALALLSREERRLLTRHTVDGVGLRQLAEREGKTLSAIKSRLHRIRSKVRLQARAALRGSSL
jgi:RNA polymerase sigma-70 factor (ECF subfamily)